MERRDFLKKSIGAGIIAGATLSLGGYQKLLAGTPHNKPLDPHAYDMVAIKGGEPDFMLDKAMDALGGMSRYVKKGQSVVVKPNIGWDAPADRAANTNPKLVKRVIEHCFNAGAKVVYVLDHTCDNWQKCYINSGIQRAVLDAKGKMVPANSETYYEAVNVGGKRLKNTKVHEKILEADVYINVPVLKDHRSARLTIAMKNQMGIVWDRGTWHSNDLHQCISDFSNYRQPDLNIVDAYYVMKKNGPRGTSKGDLVEMKSLLVSADCVAIDAAATKLFGKDPKDVEYIKLAHKAGFGTMNLDSLNIKRIIL